MPSLINHLSKTEQQDLFKQLFYLNIKEYTGLCEKFNIPIAIYIELPDGQLKKTTDKDRKGVILTKLRKFLTSGRQPEPTTIPKKIVKPKTELSTWTVDSPIFYGSYDRNNVTFFKLLSQQTKGKFKDGAIARHVIRDFWTSGKAPTIKQFAKAWEKAVKDHDKPKPEWAFLTDLVNGMNEKDWKPYRVKQAKAALKILNSL